MYNYRRSKVFSSVKNATPKPEINQISKSFFPFKNLSKAKEQYAFQYERWEEMRSQFRNMSVEDLSKGKTGMQFSPHQLIRQNSMLADNDINKNKKKVEQRVKEKKHIQSTEDYSKKFYKSRPKTGKNYTKQYPKEPSEEKKVKVFFKPYKIPYKNKKLFRSSLNDMRKIQFYNLGGQEQIPNRKIILKKSLVLNKVMYAVELSSIHRGLIFACHTMGEVFNKTKLAIGPQEVKEYLMFFLVQNLQQLGEKLFDFLYFEGSQLKIDKEAIKRTKMTKQKYVSILQENSEENKEKEKINEIKPEDLQESQIPISQHLQISKKGENESKVVSQIQEDSLIKSKIAVSQMAESKLQEQISISKREIIEEKEQQQQKKRDQKQKQKEEQQQEENKNS